MHNLTQFNAIYQRKGKCWTIVDQKIYLDGLGYWARNTRMSRKDLLILFIDTADLSPQPWTRESKDYALKILKDEFGVTL
jgi:hypothetical protein